MDLIGVTVTDPHTLDTVVREIDALYPDGVESLLIGIPFNYKDMTEQPAKTFGALFGLVEIYKERGTKIIYGWPDYNPSKGYYHSRILKKMLRVIKEEKPEVAVVFILDADYIARKVPAYYMLVTSEDTRKELEYAREIICGKGLLTRLRPTIMDFSRADKHIVPIENPPPY